MMVCVFVMIVMFTGYSRSLWFLGFATLNLKLWLKENPHRLLILACWQKCCCCRDAVPFMQLSNASITYLSMTHLFARFQIWVLSACAVEFLWLCYHVDVSWVMYMLTYLGLYCINHAARYANQHIWCLSWVRIKWEGCGRKGIRRKNEGMMEVGHWLVRMECHPARWSVCLPLLSSISP